MPDPVSGTGQARSGIQELLDNTGFRLEFILSNSKGRNDKSACSRTGGA